MSSVRVAPPSGGRGLPARVEEQRGAELARSRQIAGLLGPTLIVLAASEVVNPDIWNDTPAQQAYLAGTLWFVAGLSIIRAHNRWTFDWRVIITGVGWFAILGGLSRMFAPETIQRSTEDTPRLALLALQMVLLTIGVFLTIIAFWHREQSR